MNACLIEVLGAEETEFATWQSCGKIGTEVSRDLQIRRTIVEVNRQLTLKWVN
jgi:hypothetical protein